MTTHTMYGLGDPMVADSINEADPLPNQPILTNIINGLQALNQASAKQISEPDTCYLGSSLEGFTFHAQ